jgi:hypothetical protein
LEFGASLKLGRLGFGASLELGAWNLVIHWVLELGIW